MATLPSSTGSAAFVGSIEQFKDMLLRLSPPYVLLKYDATPTDYDQITDEDIRCEYLDGVLVVHSPASPQHERIGMFLALLIGKFVARRGLGELFGANVVMQLGERCLCPDLSFLRSEHVARVREGRVHGPLDLVVEVISRSTRRHDLGDKRAAYRDGRIPEIWLIDPERRRFEVDVLEGVAYSTHVLETGRWLSRVLPGFSLDVGWLWAEPLPTPPECQTESTG